MTVDIFAGPAWPLLLDLAAEGFRFVVNGDRLFIHPVHRLPPARRAALRQHRGDVLKLLRICDPTDSGVVERRDHFAGRLRAAGNGVAPAFLFRPGIPYVPGICFSCGDATGRPKFSCCWRCSLARRLACDVPIPVDVAAALDEAWVIA